MPVNTAKNYFLGKNGRERLNCAQSVIGAFKEELELGEELIRLFGTYGGGNAPGGLCGAFYAAKYLLEKEQNSNIGEFEKYFIEQAGSVNCKEIKKLYKLNCLGCVEKCVEYLVEESKIATIKLLKEA